MLGMQEDFLLDSHITFLNHGSRGACPRKVFERYQTWQKELEFHPVEFLDMLRSLGPNLRNAREALATYLKTKPDDLVRMTNATEGINVVFRSLNLKPGDEIVTTDHEYAACEKALEHLCLHTGARGVVVPITTPLISEQAFVDVVAGAFTKKTRLLFISHITSPTALHFPLKELLKQAKAAGILTLIDGAHVPGHLPLSLSDLASQGADFYVGNTHKWVMGPKGAAFLWVRHELQDRIDPLVISHGWQAKRGTEVGPLGGPAFIDRMESQATRDPAAFLTIPAALRYLESLPNKNIHEETALFLDSVGKDWAERTGLELLGNKDLRARRMICLPLPEQEAWKAKRLHDYLWEKHKIEVHVIEWKNRLLVRISIQVYNRPQQAHDLVGILGRLFSL